MMKLSQAEFESINWNEFSVEEIECLIDMGYFTEKDIVWYYNNPQWRDDSL